MSLLALSDMYHKDNYLKKIDGFDNAYHYYCHEKAKEFYAEYAHVSNNFRQKLIEFHSRINQMIATESYSKQVTALNTKFDFPVIELYEPFQKIKSSITIEKVIEQKKKGLKIIICGEGAVGKTSLINRLFYGYLPEYYPGLMDTLDVKYEDKETRTMYSQLFLWDTAGQEDYDRLRPLAYPETDLFCVCFKRNRPESFKNISSRWLPEINHHLPNSPIVLVGCQLDMLSNPDEKKRLRYRYFDKFVTFEDSVQMAKNIGALTYIETSALTGEGNIADFAEIITKSHIMFKQISQPIKSKKNCTIC